MTQPEYGPENDLTIDQWEVLNLLELMKRHELELPLDAMVADGLPMLGYVEFSPKDAVDMAAQVAHAALMVYLGFRDEAAPDPSPEDVFQALVRAFLAGFRAGHFVTIAHARTEVLKALYAVLEDEA